MMATREVVEKFVGLLAAGDPDAVVKVFADDIDWYVPGSPSLPWTGQHSKASDVADYLRTLAANIDGLDASQSRSAWAASVAGNRCGRLTRQHANPVAIRLQAPPGQGSRQLLTGPGSLGCSLSGVVSMESHGARGSESSTVCISAASRARQGSRARGPRRASSTAASGVLVRRVPSR